VEFVTTLDRHVISQEGLNVQTVRGERTKDAVSVKIKDGLHAMHVKVRERFKH
jgi:hypothetical protein